MTTKLLFRVARLEEYLPVLLSFIQGERWKGLLQRAYPGLLNLKGDQEKIIAYLKKEEQTLLPALEAASREYREAWAKHEKGVIDTLEGLHETVFPEDEYTARITINPICPRYLDTAMFDLSISMHANTMRTVCIHELSHFLFFNKIKEIMPEIESSEYEHPGLMWKLSEMMPGVLFNKKIIEENELQEESLVYDSIRRLRIEGRPILDTLRTFYDERKSFEEFIKTSYKYLQEHEKEIMI